LRLFGTSGVASGQTSKTSLPSMEPSDHPAEEGVGPFRTELEQATVQSKPAPEAMKSAEATVPNAESFTEAETDYDQLRDRGLQALAAGRTPEALEAFGRALRLRPDRTEAHLNIGRAFERAGKIEAARYAYLQGLESDLTSAEARSALAALPPPPPKREDFQVGQMLSSTSDKRVYKVLDVKKGGFGVVYIVEDCQAQGQYYALKTFQARFLWSEDDRERFEREALTWVMLDRHPHIVSAQLIVRIEGIPCLVLEYLPGGDIAHLIAQEPLEPARATELALQFCDGMAYAHGKLGIVHRDIKPSNCLLDERGTLKITDFGLARAFGEAQEHGLGLAGMGAEVTSQYTTTAGTRQFMAPEQFQAGATLDTRTDIYAFGIMLYNMLTGELPLVGGVAEAFIEENAPDYKLPASLLQLILQCVERERAKRPPSFGAVREVLASTYRELTGRSAPAPPASIAMGWQELTQKGVALDTLERHEEAVACYDRGLEINPLGIGLWQNKGVALRALGRYEEAVACYDRGLEITPRDATLWTAKGSALNYLKRYAEAVACYDQGLEINPRDSDPWKCKGLALYSLQRYEEAVACYDRGLEISPRDSGLWKNKGVALYYLRRYAEAVACYDRGLEINPRDSGLWKNKGLALYYLRRYAEAVACSDRGLEINPRDSGMWDNKGWALKKLGRTAEANQCFEKARQLAGR